MSEHGWCIAAVIVAGITGIIAYFAGIAVEAGLVQPIRREDNDEEPDNINGGGG